MANLRELLEELKRRRLKGAPAGPTTSPPAASGRAPASKLDPAPSTSSESPAEAWLNERSVDPETLSPGEIVNVLEGLTPSGKDKQGRQISFVEHGIEILGDTEGVRTVGDWTRTPLIGNWRRRA